MGLLVMAATALAAWHKPHLVKGLPLETAAYAGRLRVNSSTAAEPARYIFYWLFRSRDGNPHAPLLVWMNGGPGLSSMFGLFNEIGPLQLDPEGQLVPRPIHWNENLTLVFVDQPVGVGFSSGPLPTSVEEAAIDMHNFLLGLLSIHVQLRGADLYLSGESFCGHYFPPLVARILAENAKGAGLRLRGVAIGGMQSDIRRRVHRWPEQAFAFGLLTKPQFRRGVQLAARFVTLLDEPGVPLRTAMEPKHALEQMMHDAGINKLNLARQRGSYCLSRFAPFMNASNKMFHVPENVTFHEHSLAVEYALISDVRNTYGPELVAALRWVRILLYEGMWDWEDGVLQIEDFLEAGLQGGFNLSSGGGSVGRQRWTSDGTLLGWVESKANLTHVVVRNAGHLAPLDQPFAARELITRWISGGDLRRDRSGYREARELQDTYSAHPCDDGERLTRPPEASAPPQVPDGLPPLVFSLGTVCGYVLVAAAAGLLARSLKEWRSAASRASALRERLLTAGRPPS